MNIGNRKTTTKFYDAPVPKEIQDSLFDFIHSVPDHKSLRPWRFIVINQDKYEHMREEYHALSETECELPSITLEMLNKKLDRSPLLIIAILSPNMKKQVSYQDQIISAGIAAYTVSISAMTLGLGCFWSTGVLTKSKILKRVLELHSDEEIIGFLNIGTPMLLREKRKDICVSEYVDDFGVIKEKYCDQAI